MPPLKAGPRSRTRSGAWITPPRRYAIYHRDDYRCCWCGADLRDPAQAHRRTLDHLLDGTHVSHLLVTACAACNGRRKDRGVAEWLRYLRDSGGPDLAEVLGRLRRRHHALNMSRGKLDAALTKYVPPRDPEAPREWFDKGGVIW